MEIIDERPNNKIELLASLEIGTVFEMDECVFIKTDISQGGYSLIVRPSDGVGWYQRGDTPVHVINAEMRIKP